MARGGKNADADADEGRPVTVREALDAYRADLIARGGDVHNVARVRGHLSNTLSAETVALLTARELRRFRDSLLAKKLRASSVNRISNALRAALNLAAAHDQRINNQTAWRTGLANIFDAAQARNVILSDQVVREIIIAAFAIGPELGLLVETAPRQPVDPWCSISLEREGSKALSQISTASCRRDTTSSRQGD